MDTLKNNIEENPNDHQKEWLNLSLAPYLGDSSSNSRHTASVKVYTCSFCKRKFYSSQALGGHQNAHRRERDAVRRYHIPKTMNAFELSLKVHSFVQKPGRDREATVARFTDNGVRYGASWVHPYTGEGDVNLKWPGSFYLNLQPDSDDQSDPHRLDLNLKL
ncbi:hypothetical protein L2E82_25120 [Cichorium intybus]|uniref:Uncharacterized protein n=1 Tax=Cichorium intybus TaxID=13427 RepID=A0ACB9E2K6_CICIN|nr:hypothetical protein L2E82_25120 [Cichorium intybus]